MLITVRRALGFGGLSRSRLVAGEKGLDRVVEFVDIMEVPDVTDWLRPRELLVTCAYAIREDPAAQVRLVRALARSDGAGLAVKPSRFLGTMPKAMIDAANEENLPLIEIPGSIPFIEITHPLLSAILSEQVKTNALKETQWRMKGDFFADILKNGCGAIAVQEAKARALGIELSKPYVVVVARALCNGDRDGMVLNRLLAEIVRESETEVGEQCAAFEHDGSFVGVWPAGASIDRKSVV